MYLSSNRKLSRFFVMMNIAFVLVISCTLRQSCGVLAIHRDDSRGWSMRHIKSALRSFPSLALHFSKRRRCSKGISSPSSPLAKVFLAWKFRTSRSRTTRGLTMAAQTTAPTVVLTREKGKNEKLQKILEPYGIRCIEFPIVETVDKPQKKDLVDAIKAGGWSYVAVTSPEAAAVLLWAWEEAGKPEIQIVSVGRGTADALSPLSSVFEPSKAKAEYLAEELPWPSGADRCRVLWPTSVKAKNVLRDGLSKRGFKVTRLDTYSTEPVKFVPEHEVNEARLADVVTFASGSQIDAWTQIVGNERLISGDMGVALIGRGSSTKAVDKLSLPKETIRFPESPGVDGWAQSVLELLGIESRLD